MRSLIYFYAKRPPSGAGLEVEDMKKADPRTDSELMTSFHARGDQDAFELLVSRHEALVVRVCERILRDEHGARDAAQAVFLVLARKGASLDLERPLGPWLHHVAAGIALSARRQREARRAREHQARVPSADPGHAEGSEPALGEILDGELDGLPEKYRRPLILFHVEGRSLEETAATLGSPAGTVGAWLSRGRKLLRERLVRRGVQALSGGALLAFLAKEARTASSAGGDWARLAAHSGAGGIIPGTVESLTEGARVMFFMAKLKAAGMALIAAGLFFGAHMVLLAPDRVAASEINPEPRTPELSVGRAPAPEAPEATVLFEAGEPVASSFPPTSDLVGHWKFEDDKQSKTAVDATGHADGRLVGGAAFGEGKLGGGLRCDGTGGHVVVPSTEDLDKVQTGNYTLAAWFRPESVPPGKESANDANYGIVLKTGWHLGLYYTNEKKFVMAHWLVGEKPEEPAWTGTGTWDDEYEPGAWYHLIGTVDRSAGKIAIYVNGELKNTTEFTPNAEARAYGKMTWKIGIGNPGAKEWSWPAQGSIDDVRIYSRALSAAESKALYETR
jgi:RNA polymerase sigma factor (sigma-70 family)